MFKWLRRIFRMRNGTPKSPKSLVKALSEPAHSARLITEFSQAHVWLMIESETLAKEQPSQDEMLDFIRSQARDLGMKGKVEPLNFVPLLGTRDGSAIQPLFTSYNTLEHYFNSTRDRERVIAIQTLFVKATVFAQPGFCKVPIVFDPDTPTERILSEPEYRAFCSLVRGD